MIKITSVYLHRFLSYSCMLIYGDLRLSGLQPCSVRGPCLKRESCSEDLTAEYGTLARESAIGLPEVARDEYPYLLLVVCSTFICSEEMPLMRLVRERM